jgi:hypothetical protein
MDEQEFARIVRIGLGRAVLHLHAHDPSPYRDVILDACLHDMRYDPQAEPYREQYLFDLVQSSGDPGFYRERLLDALTTVRSLHVRRQIAALVRLFAQEGDIEAHRLLYEVYAASVDWDWSLPDEIVALDGTAGLLFVAKRLSLDPRGGLFYLDLIEAAERKDGAESTARALAVAAVSSPHIAAFVAQALAEDLPDPDLRREWQQHEEDAASYARVRERLQAGDGWGPWLLHTWARTAPEDELAGAATDLLRETDPDRLRLYLGIFAQRPFPLDPTPIVTFAEGKDEHTAMCAVAALTHVKSPAARRVALDRLARGDYRGALPLVANYQPGDYELLEQLLRSWPNPSDVDMLGMELHQIVKAHPSADAAPALLVLYERGPYSSRRQETVQLLRDVGSLPEWLQAECRYDANPEIRAMMNE